MLTITNFFLRQNTTSTYDNKIYLNSFITFIEKVESLLALRSTCKVFYHLFENDFEVFLEKTIIKALEKKTFREAKKAIHHLALVKEITAISFKIFHSAREIDEYDKKNNRFFNQIVPFIKSIEDLFKLFTLFPYESQLFSKFQVWLFYLPGNFLTKQSKLNSNFFFFHPPSCLKTLRLLPVRIIEITCKCILDEVIHSCQKIEIASFCYLLSFLEDSVQVRMITYHLNVNQLLLENLFLLDFVWGNGHDHFTTILRKCLDEKQWTLLFAIIEAIPSKNYQDHLNLVYIWGCLEGNLSFLQIFSDQKKTLSSETIIEGICYSIEKEQLDTVRYLLSLPNIVSDVTFGNYRLFKCATEHDLVSFFKILLEQTSPSNQPVAINETFKQACKSGGWKTVSYLLTNFTCKVEEGIAIASEYNQMDLLIFFHEKGFLKTNDLQELFFEACCSNSSSMIYYYLNKTKLSSSKTIYDGFILACLCNTNIYPFLEHPYLTQKELQEGFEVAVLSKNYYAIQLLLGKNVILKHIIDQQFIQACQCNDINLIHQFIPDYISTSVLNQGLQICQKKGFIKLAELLIIHSTYDKSLWQTPAL